MILGLGTDVADIARIRRALERHGEAFYARVCTPEERMYCVAAADPSERLAARWAAKEAVMKALGTGWTQGIRFPDIEVRRDEHGAPRLFLSGVASEQAARRGIIRWHLSLSHAGGIAFAVAIGEGEPFS